MKIVNALYMLNISIPGWEICEHVKCDLCTSTVYVTLHSIPNFHGDDRGWHTVPECPTEGGNGQIRLEEDWYYGINVLKQIDS